jgi:hypothetical protein
MTPLPSILGQQFFRSPVTSYRASSFERRSDLRARRGAQPGAAGLTFAGVDRAMRAAGVQP